MIDRIASPQELESLVRRIVAQCLEARSLETRNLEARITATPGSKLAASSEAIESRELEVLTLEGRVVSVESLKALPAGIRRVVIAGRSVVTPAARDWLRERGISVESPTSGTKVVHALESAIESAPWQVMASGQRLDARQRQQVQQAFCPKQLRVAEATESDMATFQAWNQAVAQSGANASTRYVLLVETPYHWLWQSDVATWRPAIWEDGTASQDSFQRPYQADPAGPRLWFVRGPLATHRFLSFLRQWLKGGATSDAHRPVSMHGGKR